MFLLRKLEIHLKTMGNASSPWTPKSLQTRLLWLQLPQSSPVGYSNITTLLRKCSKREQNQSKSLCERTSCTCLCNNGRLRNLPWQSSATATRCFRGFTLHARQGKGTCQNFSGTKNQPTPPSLSKMGGIRTGNKAGLLKCLERSPLGSGNADEKEILVDETNNIDYEETVDYVSMTSPLKSFLIWLVELSLNLVRRNRNSWSAKTLLHTLLQTAHLKQVWWSLTVHLLLSALPQDIKHFPGLQQQRFLALHFWTTSECSTVGYCLGRLSRRQLKGQDKMQMGPRSKW